MLGVKAAEYHFYSPVGAVQTGADAQAIVSQNLDSSSTEMVLDILTQIQAAIADASLQEEPKRVIEAEVSEVRREAEKEQPNRSVFWSRLQTLTALVRAIQDSSPALQTAYHALKTLLAGHGIPLP
jgi:hypothetical protein